MTVEYYPFELNDGSVLQSGIPSPEDCSAPAPYQNTYGHIARGVVLKTYYTDDSGWSEKLYQGVQGVHVDVRLFGKRSRTLFRVPVCQGTGAIWDENTYIPRDSTKNIAGGNLVVETTPTGEKITEAHNLDGDHVLIGFLECDPLQPICFPFALPHPAAGKQYKETDGRVRRLRHNGVLIEFDKDGNFKIDATEAAKGELDSVGNEQGNSGTAGKIKLLTSDGSSEYSIELDNSGNITLTDGAGDTITLTKSSKDIALNSGATITLQSTTSLSAASPAMSFNASTTFTVTSAAITLGAGAVPIVKHTPWAAGWATLDTLLTTQINTYTGPPPPPVVSVADYLALLTAVKTISATYPAILTAITKAA